MVRSLCWANLRPKNRRHRARSEQPPTPLVVTNLCRGLLEADIARERLVRFDFGADLADPNPAHHQVRSGIRSLSQPRTRGNVCWLNRFPLKCEDLQTTASYYRRAAQSWTREAWRSFSLWFPRETRRNLQSH